MSEPIQFERRQDFHQWLSHHGDSSGGIWLLFGKKGGPVTISANEALEEALCFGWIDGQMQSLDNHSYKKYFARRRSGSHWSDKNKKLAQSLIENGQMMPQGMSAIEQAKKSGAWDASKKIIITDEQITQFKQSIAAHELALKNFLSMPPSVQKTYTGFYLDAKSETTRQNRLLKIIDRLNNNLKPM